MKKTIYPVLLSASLFWGASLQAQDSLLSSPYQAPEAYTQALKLHVLSPFVGHTKISYERYLRTGRSLECSVSLIGLGRNTTSGNEARNQRGIGFSAGYKFFNPLQKGLLGGAYIKPTIILGTFEEDYYKYQPGIQQGEQSMRSVFYYGALAEFGKQWIIADRIPIDIFLCLGLGANNTTGTQTNIFYEVGHIYGFKDFSIIGNLGIKTGLLIGKKQTLDYQKND